MRALLLAAIASLAIGLTAGAKEAPKSTPWPDEAKKAFVVLCVQDIEQGTDIRRSMAIEICVCMQPKVEAEFPWDRMMQAQKDKKSDEFMKSVEGAAHVCGPQVIEKHKNEVEL